MDVHAILTQILFEIQIVLCYGYRSFLVFYSTGGFKILFFIQFIVSILNALVIKSSLKNMKKFRKNLSSISLDST